MMLVHDSYIFDSIQTCLNVVSFKGVAKKEKKITKEQFTNQKNMHKEE